jgi:hypothetical protein
MQTNSKLDATDATIAYYSYENGIEFITAAFSKLRWMQFAESGCWTYLYKSADCTLNFILTIILHVQTHSLWVIKCMEQEVLLHCCIGQIISNLIGAVRTRQRLVFFRTKQCGLMLQRCHQRHGARCT